MRYSIIILLSLTFLFVHSPARAVDGQDSKAETKKERLRAWEIGAGATVFQFSRIDFSHFTRAEDYYKFNLQLRHNVVGPNLYIAKEITPHLYLDLQGSIGFTQQFIEGREKLRTLYMGGVGLQWRFGEYFGHGYIDPFVRVGANYLHKNFGMNYQGTEGDLPEEMTWLLENIYNKDGKDRDKMTPITFGIGMNAWLSDNFGIGLQGDYLLMPYKNIANSLQGTVRLLWRIGGKSKKSTPQVKYVEVERIVQSPPVTVEKIVEVPVKITEEPSKTLCELFNSIYFEFDKSDIREQSYVVLDKIAYILKSDLSKKYLIVGHTDSRGSDSYNIALSRRRSAAVVRALEERGVPMEMIKSRGVGKRISYAKPETSTEIREGDRKVTIEIIVNQEYWNYIPKRDY